MFAREERAGQEKVCPACKKTTTIPQVTSKADTMDALVQVGPSRGDLLFGRIALQSKLITDVQLADAIVAQEKLLASGQKAALGSILQDKGYLTDGAVRAVLKAQGEVESRAEDAQYGSIAVANRFLTQKMLERALAMQRESLNRGEPAKHLGRLLVELGFLTEQQHLAVLSAQKRMGKPVPPTGTMASVQAPGAPARAAAAPRRSEPPPIEELPPVLEAPPPVLRSPRPAAVPTTYPPPDPAAQLLPPARRAAPTAAAPSALPSVSPHGPPSAAPAGPGIPLARRGPPAAGGSGGRPTPPGVARPAPRVPPQAPPPPLDDLVDVTTPQPPEQNPVSPLMKRFMNRVKTGESAALPRRSAPPGVKTSGPPVVMKMGPPPLPGSAPPPLAGVVASGPAQGQAPTPPGGRPPAARAPVRPNPSAPPFAASPGAAPPARPATAATPGLTPAAPAALPAAAAPTARTSRPTTSSTPSGAPPPPAEEVQDFEPVESTRDPTTAEELAMADFAALDFAGEEEVPAALPADPAGESTDEALPEPETEKLSLEELRQAPDLPPGSLPPPAPSGPPGAAPRPGPEFVGSSEDDTIDESARLRPAEGPSPHLVLPDDSELAILDPLPAEAYAALPDDAPEPDPFALEPLPADVVEEALPLPDDAVEEDSHPSVPILPVDPEAPPDEIMRPEEGVAEMVAGILGDDTQDSGEAPIGMAGPVDETQGDETDGYEVPVQPGGPPPLPAPSPPPLPPRNVPVIRMDEDTHDDLPLVRGTEPPPARPSYVMQEVKGSPYFVSSTPTPLPHPAVEAPTSPDAPSASQAVPLAPFPCPHCGSDNLARARFCSGCGQPLSFRR